MNRYITDDGEKYEAANATSLVKQMMKTSWDASITMEKFMASVAERTMQQNGTHIVHDSPETFVASLIGAGLLKQVEA
jgi:hypothetical protein